ncbi:MAG: type II toxin-antitoxin system VapC family toxin [Nostocoides sp.]
MKAFVDTPVFLFAIGADHRFRADCVEFLNRSHTLGIDLHTSIEAVQEFTFHRMRRAPGELALRETQALMGTVVIHPFDKAVLARAHHLLSSTQLRGRDSVHAATALEAGFEIIVSTDADFDEVPGLRRVSPADAAR